MDLSAILILPYSALVTVAVLVLAGFMKRSRPRLVWPFLFATVSSAAFVAVPPPDTELELWVASIALLSLWAAAGTVFGAGFVRLTRLTIRAFRGR